MPSLTGKLIVIEGLEGAGKSTAINTVTEFLAQQGIKCITSREPGGTAIGEILRSIFKNPEYRDVLDDRCELLLLYAARIQLLEEVIKPALHEGTWVIADRFELSTMAYQGGGRGLDQTMINQLSIFSLDGFKPDLTLYLDISPEEGMKRVRSRGEIDRIEQQSINFFHRVHERYLSCIQNNPDVIKLDASRPVSEVQQEICNVLMDFLEHKA